MAATANTNNRRNARPMREERYIHGSAARQADIKRQLEDPYLKPERTAHQTRRHARRMNFPYVLFLSVMMAVTGFALISYIRMESALTTSVKKIASLENQVNNLRLENDETLSRIETSVNLEEIRRIAITKLGMVYAGEGQIVEIPDEGSDYVRQYADIQQ